MKKLIALVLTLAMIATLGLAFAAPGDATSDGTISVTGLAVGDVVTPYQVIKWVDSEGWKFTDQFNSLSAADLEMILGKPSTPAVGTPGEAGYIEAKPAVQGKITQELANKIAALAKGGTAEEPLTGTTWSKSHPAAGLWMITIAAANSGVVYNPPFVGADFSGTNTTNTIDIGATYSDTATAKKTEITTLKTVDQAEDEINAAKASLVGDTISFQINTTIPVFLDSYKNPSFKLTDVMSAGLELVVDSDHPISVKYGDTTAMNNGSLNGDSNVTITKDSAVKYTVEFKKEYLDSNKASVPVLVTYYAKVTNAATFNVNRDDNTVTVEYSNGPNEEKGIEKDMTNHYTFSIGASIIGRQGKKGYEAVKVGVDAEGKELTELREVTLDDGDGTATAHSLEGALFGLYTSEAAAIAGKKPTDENNGLVVNKNYPNGATFTTLADGVISFTGLDAGEYWLKEIDAPDGYIKDTLAHKVVIDAKYEKKSIEETTTGGMKVTYQTSVLKNYTVTIDGLTTTYTFDNTGATIVDPVVHDVTTNEDRIKNVKGVELPSTGGIGTTIFYILGGLLVVGAAVILVARRKAQD